MCNIVVKTEYYQSELEDGLNLKILPEAKNISVLSGYSGYNGLKGKKVVFYGEI